MIGNIRRRCECDTDPFQGCQIQSSTSIVVQFNVALTEDGWTHVCDIVFTRYPRACALDQTGRWIDKAVPFERSHRILDDSVGLCVVLKHRPKMNPVTGFFGDDGTRLAFEAVELDSVGKLVQVKVLQRGAKTN